MAAWHLRTQYLAPQEVTRPGVKNTDNNANSWISVCLSNLPVDSRRFPPLYEKALGVTHALFFEKHRLLCALDGSVLYSL